MNNIIVMPDYFRVFGHEGKRWFIKVPKTFNSNSSLKLNHHDLNRFGITERQVILELYLLDGGKEGFYLANLHDKQYIYCGVSYEDVQETLYSLGFGVKE